MTDKPENKPISNDQIDRDHAKPVDVHTWSDYPEINKLVDELWLQVVEPALGGKSNNKGKSDPKRQLKVLRPVCSLARRSHFVYWGQQKQQCLSG